MSAKKPAPKKKRAAYRPEAEISHIKDLVPDPDNLREHNERNIDMIGTSLQRVGAARSIVIDEENVIRAGNGTVEAASAVGITKVRVVEASGNEIIAVRRRGLTPEQKRLLSMFDNRSSDLSTWNVDAIKKAYAERPEEFRGAFTDKEIEFLLSAAPQDSGDVLAEQKAKDQRTLSERFGVPPFSVLDVDKDYWKPRKKAWLALGIQSESGRDRGLLKHNPNLRSFGTSKKSYAGGSGTSIFDPVLCELAYRWFCPPGGLVIDPFAGGSVRGIVASKLGRRYVGIDLRPEQVQSNRVQAAEICGKEIHMPEWIEGDARDVAQLCANRHADFIFTCPPYFDLEIYSDDARDLSNGTYDDFRQALRAVAIASGSLLVNDRFAAIVVGDVRDKQGRYRGLPWHTVEAFHDAGFSLWNEAVLVTTRGTLPLRVGGGFRASRKLGKTHQNVLIFCKGDARKAVDLIGEVDFGDPAQMPEFAIKSGP